MTTYTYNLMTEYGWMRAAVCGKAARAGGLNAHKLGARLAKNLKNVALFVAAPFVGLAYLIAFPFVGVAMLAWVAAKAAMKNEKTRPVALALAAPFIGLAFVTLGPIAGLGMVAWFAGKKLCA